VSPVQVRPPLFDSFFPDEPIGQYHSDMEWWGTSQLWTLLSKGPASFHQQYGLGARQKYAPSDALKKGTLPFEDWTLETRDGALDAVANRTLALVPRHRAVLGGATPNTAILQSYRVAFAPLENGFSLFEQVTPGYRAHSIEHLGLLTMILQAALLQSVSPRPGESEVIRVFPACPPQWNASCRLLGRGGFLVSSEVKNGRVQFGRNRISAR
jgi:hypothetical protein